jgi:hypothetical protein
LFCVGKDVLLLVAVPGYEEGDGWRRRVSQGHIFGEIVIDTVDEESW